jgi:exopolyphosphatase/guanosine-5'-triphosphate,3'-diphosphate pyrophosphatase
MGDHIAPSPQHGGKRRGTRNRGGNRRKSADAAASRAPSNGRKANDRAGNMAQNVKAALKAGSNRKRGSAEQAEPRNRNWLGKTAYAALDLGTNNCRLLIARAAQDGFTVVDAFSRVVRLGEGLATTGRMSDEAMDRAVEALSVCADKLKRRNVVLARSVATEACRQAENGLEFIERVRRETGIVLNIITAEEEARLAVMGCQALLEPGEGPALIFDIGGGSTELVLVSTDGVTPEILDWESIPWGVVSLTESEAAEGDDPDALKKTYEAMKAKVHARLADFAARLPVGSGDHRLLGTSGTVTTLASVHLQLKSYDRRKIDGLHMSTAAMREISQTLASRPPAGRAEFPTIGHDRSDLVVAGCAILEAIFDIWPGERLGIADRGIREGILRALMANDNRRRNSQSREFS